MRYGIFLFFLGFSILSFAGNLTVQPTTTLSALTSNNTSAANSFRSQSNGNLGASNISKVDVHSLLYSGANTQVFAHLLLWFGRSDHMNIGYSSTDPAQVHAQVEDMISRGIQGVILDWYGPNNSEDQAAQLVMKEAETHPGFTFAIMLDHGALQQSCGGCSTQDVVIRDLQYAEQTYFPSSAYYRINGQPMVTNFDLSTSVDWNAVQSALASKPAFLFQDNPGFSEPLSQGAYSWIQPTLPDYGMQYLASFYQAGMPFAKEETIGAGYKGFNDTMAGWGTHRVMSQQCGQTWLQTFSEINGLYNSGKQLSTLQLVTWNDYEEATEIESGIDNCLSISGSVTGSTLQWSVKGNENTLDHYTVYISTDGQNLMPLGDQSVGSSSVDLCSYPLAAGNYSLFVQAVGKPGILNHITSVLAYTPPCPVSSTTPSATIQLSASPQSVTIGSAGSAGLGLSVAAPTAALSAPVSLSCSNLPAGLTCTFSPASVTPSASAAKSTLTISSTAASAANKRHSKEPGFPFYNLAGFGIAGFVVVGGIEKRRARRLMALSAILAGGLLLSSCGGSGAAQKTVTSTGTSTPAGTYSVVVNASSGSTQATAKVSVTVQ
ncbi:MAG TPA: hypothetical protein VMB18_13750 [Terriglobales bacterium]|nr:hypothetical protein [Terriglobales bacterium]